MNKIWFPLVVLLCFATTSKLRADQAADEATIRNNVAAYVAAYNNHDAKTLATFWSPDAVYVNPETGDEAVGHEAIADQFAAILANLGDAKLAVDVKSIVFLSPTVAVERGTARVVNKSEKEPKKTDYTAIHVKRNGKWLLDRVSEEESPVILLELRTSEGSGMDDWQLGRPRRTQPRRYDVQMDQESDVYHAAVCHFHRGSTGYVRNSAHRLGREYGKDSVLGVRFRRGFRRSDMDQEGQSLDYQCCRDDAGWPQNLGDQHLDCSR